MQVPLRLLQAVRPNEHPGLLLATAYSTAGLSVAPFLLPALAEAYDVGLGLASVATAAQLGGFVIGSWGGGRILAPRGRNLAGALAVTVVCNALCALLPVFAVLVALRVLNGVALGVITWFAWSQVFGDERRMSDIAVIGPLVGVSTTPIAAGLIDRFGVEAIFLTLAATAVVPLAFSRRSGRLEPDLLVKRDKGAARHAATPAAMWILVLLGLMTLGGSAVFTFGAVVGADNTGMSLTAISFAYSANALASIPSARWSGRRGVAGAWLIGCGLAAVVLASTSISAAFIAAIAFWGFAYWMGVPGVYAILSACSRYPEERAGDAQAIMAAGRVVGPLAGGVVLDVTNPTVLGLAGGGLMILASIGFIVQDRRTGSPPVAPH